MRETQEQIVSELGVRPHIDAAYEVERRVSFLVDYASQIQGVKGFVLGVSGGQDSTLAAKLAQLAVERMRSEGLKAEFVAVRLPYSVQADEDDAQLALSFIQADRVAVVNIASAVDALVSEVEASIETEVGDFNKGNIKARMRMVAQYAIAGNYSLLVIGTDHAAEAITGFFTKYGDGAADVMPLAGLTKGQGVELLRHLEAPDRLWKKVPTADLLDEVPGQTDEESLGVSYTEIDRYLMGDQISEGSTLNLQQRYFTTVHKRRLPATPHDTWWRETGA